MSPKIGVVILHPPSQSESDRERHYANTRECLSTLMTFEPQCEVFLVDNGAGEQRLRSLSKVAGSQRVENLGFAAGVNDGLRALAKQSFDYYLLLNNDVVIVQKFLDSLVDVIDASEKNMMVSPVILQFKYPDKIWAAGGRFNWILARPSNRSDLDRTKKFYEVDFNSGCCVLMKKEVIQEIGFLDEAFFFGMEDVDLCLRTQARGYKCLLDTRVSVLHKGGEASGGHQNPFTIYNLLRGNLLLANKHYIVRHRIIPYLYFMILSLKIGYNCLKQSPLERSSGLRAVLNVWQEAFHGFENRH